MERISRVSGEARAGRRRHDSDEGSAISPRGSEGSDRTSISVTLTAAGVTLLGVIASIGTTVGLGISGEWWLRVVAGVGSTVALVLIVKLTTRAGRGPLARLAKWTISAPVEED